MSSSPLTDDLRFFRFFHIALHFLFILIIIRSFFDSILHYQLLDESIRQTLLHHDGDSITVCENYSLIIEDFIIKKNDSARSIIFFLVLTMFIFVSAMLIIGQNWTIITLYTIFQLMLLTLNLFIPFLLPFTSVTIVVASTCLNFTCIIFKIRLNLGRSSRQIDDNDDKSEIIPTDRRLEISDPIPLDGRSIVQFQQQHQHISPFAIQHEQIPFLRSNHHHRHIHGGGVGGNADEEGRTTF
ncbi:hypothetical protein DERF_004139 [Dermatophagoides farinae]|uniref:Uncharacterized protein n=1 Tax=Dermatophagoides farinae TaxID=6954 RepID=A0A922IG30_DERFA|nr:hypothetical protein DERF_004139 [Dermatophagoides farinae]